MKKKQKAWAVYHKEKRDISDTIFTSRKKALAYWKKAWECQKYEFPNLPKMHLDRIKSNYKIIRIEVSYNVEN